MQLLVLVLVAVVVLPGMVEAPMPALPPTWEVLTVAWGPPILVGLAAAAIAGQARRALAKGLPVSLGLLRSRLRGLQWMSVLALGVAVSAFGWLDWIRAGLGNPPLVDEAIALTPALAGWLACWWAWQPIEIALRDSLGIPTELESPRSRIGFVVQQFRNQCALLGAPMLLALAAAESAGWVAEQWIAPGSPLQALLVPLSVVAAVAASPPLVVRLLDTVPLPPGPMGARVLQVLADNRVRVRQVRIWRTGGMLLNGVVMGVTGPVRYMLLTDGLVAALDPEPLRAVVAHEAGHIRRRHLPWFVVIFAGVLGMVGWIAEGPIAAGLEWGERAVGRVVPQEPPIDWEAVREQGLEWRVIDETAFALDQPPAWRTWVAAGVVLLLAVPLLGFVSRRFERQADTFAVQYLSVVGPAATTHDRSGEALTPATAAVQPGAVMALCRALGRVAELNGLDPRAPSFRHGSIAWRQRYLVSLVSTPLLRIPIDRQVRLLKLAGATMLGLVVAAEVMLWWRGLG